MEETKKEFWVIAEHRDEEIEGASLEVLSEARRLANKAKAHVVALVIGHSAASFSEQLVQHGADKVYFVMHDLLKAYTTDGYTAAIAELIQKHDPEVFFLAATVLGRDLASRLAARLKTGLVSDCTVLDFNKLGFLEMTKPSCGGRVYSTFVGSSSRPQIVSVRPGILGVGKPMKGRVSKVEELTVDISPEMIRTQRLGISQVGRDKLDILEAEVVLAYGRGIGNHEMVAQMEELSRLLEASLGGSRAAVDERWISFDRQIGQTGKTISPKVIVCCGISGAQQFTMGMRDAKFIAAINNDRRAPIFSVADVSVLGDLHEVIPELINQLQSHAKQLR